MSTIKNIIELLKNICDIANSIICIINSENWLELTASIFALIAGLLGLAGIIIIFITALKKITKTYFPFCKETHFYTSHNFILTD